MIRRSSNQFMYNYQRSLNRTYNHQSKLLEQSDGSRLHRPSDNSIDYSKYLRYNFSQNENTQYQTNVDNALSWMKVSDDALVNMTDIMKTFKAKTVAASTASQTDSDNQAIAKEMYALIQETVALGNNQQGDRYTFAGQAATIRPFTLSEEQYDRGLAKTLDEKQAKFFNTAETNDEITQMLTLKTDAGDTYYLDTNTGYIYTKQFMDSGYKEVLAQNRKTVDPTQDAFAKLGNDFFNSGTSTFTDATQSTNFKISDFFDSRGIVRDTVDSSGDSAVANVGLAFTNSAGEIVDIEDGTQLTMAAGSTVTAQPGSLLVYSTADSAWHFGETAGESVTLDDSVQIMTQNGNTYSYATFNQAVANGDVTLTNNMWIRTITDANITFTNAQNVTVNDGTYVINGNKVTLNSGTNFTDSNGTNYTTTDHMKTLNAIDSNGNTINLKLMTIAQTIVSYSGDNNYISMAKLNGSADQSSDTVNLTGADIFGRDLFDGVNSGNDASGCAMLNNMITVYQKTNGSDQSWLSGDGVEMADQIHQTTNRAESKLGSRQQLYTAVKDMLITQNETITSDIVDVSGTDIAKLATDLMEQSSVMSLALSMGGRILPMSLADYI
ncbi:MAG: hypothetical protein IJ575_02655 [Selenomonadaceae bacterium]|nr:hypothetical protein [Selenomonadaceae bacterium]